MQRPLLCKVLHLIALCRAAMEGSMYSVTHSKREKEDLFATNNDHGLFRIRLGKRSLKIIYRFVVFYSPLKSGNVIFLSMINWTSFSKLKMSIVVNLNLFLLFVFLVFILFTCFLIKKLFGINYGQIILAGNLNSGLSYLLTTVPKLGTKPVKVLWSWVFGHSVKI